MTPADTPGAVPISPVQRELAQHVALEQVRPVVATPDSRPSLQAPPHSSPLHLALPHPTPAGINPVPGPAAGMHRRPAQGVRAAGRPAVGADRWHAGGKEC